ncbi:uncharacterized protein LOC124821199 [Vigna umbellata]|uniref:uncharacterized protein LOC124821199 n=1 Tax=Vigna umbellata TaxID=87088 RepID=UPI001F5ED566|nr:uncharacterized protein LOC124821199 [Vigna umbellata]
MDQDPAAFVQEMRRRMEAMQAEIETLRAERDAARGAHANRPTRALSPVVEMPETDLDSEDGTDPMTESYDQEREQSEAESYRGANRPTTAGRVRALHPFTATIMEEQIPDRMFPSLEKYDGSGDPEEHLRSSVDAMTVYSPRENVWCRVFSLSIKGEALAWFHSLRPRTINSFATLRDKFERQFSAGRARNLTYLELTNIKQEKGESLRAFMDRFNRTARQVKGVGKKFTISTLATALRPSQFADNLFAEPPLTLDELQERAARFMRIEEMRAVRPSKSLPKADGTKHCTYHLNIGHSIEECTVLKDEVEELIRAGHLRRFVKEERRIRSSPRRSRVERNDRREDRRSDRRRSRSRSHDRSLRGTINTISGEFVRGASASARKRNLRELKSVHRVDVRKRHMPPITFTDEDFHAPDLEEDDPMVITAVIARYSVGKVLVDQGSSVNILYWKTFQQMDISEDLIAPYNEQIVGFSGERVDTRGYVDLRTCLGTERSKEVKTRFLLVDANTSYNVLLGRPCLNAFGAIVSTPHLTLKFPLDNGNICAVRSDQTIARECYMAGLKVQPSSSGSRSRSRRR